MKNVEMKREGDKLVITIDMSKTFGRSASGKTTIIATTEGNVCPPGSVPDVKIGINVYCK
jgi:hypothetical protein